jgi:DNA-binding XRE family transcriptional regulator
MPVTESPSTAALVKETRKRLGLTQVQFAEALEVSF